MANSELMVITLLVIWFIAIENGPVEIVDFPINSMVDLSHSFLLTFTRGQLEFIYDTVWIYIDFYMMYGCSSPQNRF